jgi:serine/threonine-protein kinase RsbW
MAASTASLTVPGELPQIRCIRHWLEGVLADRRLSAHDVSDLALAVAEICTNIVRHGYGSAGGGDIEIQVSNQEDAVHVVILDRAPPFSPDRIEVPPLDALQEGGYGLALARSVVDDMRFEHAPGRNRTILVKRERHGGDT